MLIDGEKWACEACVRGHRVSNCQHSDRPLQHINKKGRPVSQCQHCRALRKSRSSHLKCDCADKSHKCIHKGGVEGHKEICCCNHGGRCTCSHKKDQPSLDPVPESDSETESVPLKTSKGGGIRHRRRANTIHSDGVLTFDENGHHKPTYKHTKPSQKCGPYQLNRVNSHHSNENMGNRSLDNLLNTPSLADSGSTGSPVGGNAAQELRKTRSETASPLMSGSSNFNPGSGLPPLDLSALACPQYIPNAMDFFGALSDHEQPLYSAGLSAPSVDWSSYDGLDFANKAPESFGASSYGQPPSFGGLEFSGSEQPTLTTNTSTPGDLSDSEDFLPSADAFAFESSFRTSTTSSGLDLGQTQADLLGSTNLTSIDFDQFKSMKGTANMFLPIPTSLSGEEPTTLAPSSRPTAYSYADDDSTIWMMADTGMPPATFLGTQ